MTQRERIEEFPRLCWWGVVLKADSEKIWYPWGIVLSLIFFVFVLFDFHEASISGIAIDSLLIALWLPWLPTWCIKVQDHFRSTTT